VQERLDKLSIPVKVPRRDSPWIVGIAFCKACGRPLYSNRQQVKGKTYEYMRCVGVRDRTCSSGNIRLDRLEEAINEQINEKCGNVLYMEQQILHGSDHAAEIAEVTEAVKDLAGKVALAEALDEPMEADRSTLEILKTRRRNLESMTSEPDRIVYAATGLTVPQYWVTLKAAGKRALLVARGAKVRAQADGKRVDCDLDPGTLAGTIDTPYRNN
jgi:Recombinase zinc beta ribbon domain